MGLAAQAQTQALTQTEPASALKSQVEQWAATKQGLPRSQVNLEPLDPRLKVQACGSPLQIDQPFSAPTTLRARCRQPDWQLFVRVSYANPVAESSPSAPATAAVGAAPPGEAAAKPAQPRSAVVLTRSIPRGSLVGPGAVEVSTVSAREWDATVVTDPKTLNLMEATRDLPAGAPLRTTDLRPATLVRQGQLVLLTVGEGTGFLVSVRLEAMQDGRLGDQVLLRNRDSGRTVTGVVTGMNTAKGA